MSVGPQIQGLFLLVLLAVLGTIGLAVVLLLLVSWRHQLGRQRKADRGDEPRKPDAWTLSGQRLEVQDDEPPFKR